MNKIYTRQADYSKTRLNRKKNLFALVDGYLNSNKTLRKL